MPFGYLPDYVWLIAVEHKIKLNWLKDMLYTLGIIYSMINFFKNEIRLQIPAVKLQHCF